MNRAGDTRPSGWRRSPAQPQTEVTGEFPPPSATRDEILAGVRPWVFALGRIDDPPRWLETLAESGDDPLVVAECNTVLGIVAARDGLYPKAIAFLDRADQAYEAVEVPPDGVATRFGCLMFRGYATLEGPETQSLAASLFETATRYAERHGFDYGIQIGRLNLGWIDLKRGNATGAILHLVEIVTSERPIQRPYGHARRALAMVLAAGGDYGEALHQALTAVEIAGTEHPRDRVLSLALAGSLMVALGDVDGGERTLAEVLEARGGRADSAIEFAVKDLQIRLHVAKGVPERALDLAISLDPDDLAAQDHLASPTEILMTVLLALDEPRRAIQVATSRGPAPTHHQPPILELLAQSHAACHEWDQAVVCLRRSEDLRASFEFTPQVLLKLYSVPHASIRSEAARLRRQHDSIRELAEHGDRLLDLVAHELTGPLGNVRLALDLASEHPEMAGDRLRSARQALQRMRRTTASLRVGQDLDFRSIIGEVESVVLAPIVEEVVDQFRPAARSKSIRLTVTSSGVQSLETAVDAVEICLSNLISNAIKFSPPETEVIIDITQGEASALKVSDGQSVARVAVEDQGPGLSDADMARLFTRRARLSARPTAGETSDGLGLFLSRHLAIALGGELAAERRQSGARFVFELPLASYS